MPLEVIRVIRADPGERGLERQRPLVEMVDRRRVTTGALVRLRERTQPIGTAGVDADRLLQGANGLGGLAELRVRDAEQEVRFAPRGVGA